MPNLKGGKNYKKSKHTTAQGGQALIEAESDQMYGRVVRILGDRNMRVYCNDNVSRICRVCGAMRKRVYVNIGDVVLVSIRDLANTTEKEREDKTFKSIGIKEKSLSEREQERGDIIHKYQQEDLSKLKKVKGINEKLFLQLETVDGKVLGELRTRDEENDYVGITFDASSDEDDEDDEDDEEVKHDKRTKKQVKAKESKHSKVEETAQVESVDREINIDDI